MENSESGKKMVFSSPCSTTAERIVDSSSIAEQADTWKIRNVEVTPQDQQRFKEDGFIHFPKVISPTFVNQLRERFDELFDGNFETGIYPDEWHWRKGISKEDAFREIVNAWKSDLLIRKLVLAPELGKMAAELMGWVGSRIAQDDILWKPPQTKGVGLHRDSSYISKQFEPFENNSITIWVALDDADSETGIVQYLVGSHHQDALDIEVGKGFFNDTKQENARLRKFTMTNLKVKAGDVLCHHQDILHGSTENNTLDRPRRAVGIHLIREDVKWSTKNTIDYIYGRYKLRNEDTLRDEFFPVLWSHRDKAKL